MKTVSNSFIAKATLALALAAGGTAAYAQETDAPTPPEAPAPGDEQAPSTEPAPAPTGEPVDQDGDGLDDVTGEPVPGDASAEL